MLLSFIFIAVALILFGVSIWLLSLSFTPIIPHRFGITVSEVIGKASNISSPLRTELKAGSFTRRPESYSNKHTREQLFIYLDAEDDLTRVYERLESSPARRIALDVPQQTQLRSNVSWRLLYAKAKDLGKDIIIQSADHQIRSIVKAAGFKVADLPKTASFQHASRPGRGMVQSGARKEVTSTVEDKWVTFDPDELDIDVAAPPASSSSAIPRKQSSLDFVEDPISRTEPKVQLEEAQQDDQDYFLQESEQPIPVQSRTQRSSASSTQSLEDPFAFDDNDTLELPAQQKEKRAIPLPNEDQLLNPFPDVSTESEFESPLSPATQPPPKDQDSSGQNEYPRTLELSGELNYPKQVYEGDSRNITLIVQPIGFVPGLQGDKVCTWDKPNGQGVGVAIEETDAEEQELEVELLTGLTCLGEKIQRQSLVQKKLEYRWICKFENTGNHDLCLLLRVVKHSSKDALASAGDKRNLGTIAQTIRVVKFDHISHSQVRMASMMVGLAGFTSTLVGIITNIHGSIP